MKVYGEVGVYIRVFFTSTLHAPVALPLERASGWVDPRTSLEDMEKIKILDPTEARTPIPQSSNP
jgi:hypothetical protein